MGADPRFFERLGPLRAGDLAADLEGLLTGDPDALIHDANEPAAAASGELCFLAVAGSAPLRAPGAIVIVMGGEGGPAVEDAAAVIACANPKAAFARALNRLIALRRHDAEAAIHASAVIGAGARIGPNAVVGQGAVIGEDVELGPGAVIGPGVEIGAGSRIASCASVQCALIGARCEIQAGVVIGECGFGLAADARGLVNIPHIGRVVIGDEVTIGANCTIDRGMIRDTRLGKGSRLDNLCHVAHNVDIGEYVVMAAFAGVSGSVTVGRGAQFGGRAGVADHVDIGSGARLAAFSGVMRNVPEGETWAGSPAQPIQRFMRETVWLKKAAARRGKPGRSSSGGEGET